MVDFDVVKFVVGYRWNKGGKEEESRECFRIIDKRDRNYINMQDLKTALSNYLDFPLHEQDIADFMAECDPNSTGSVNLKDFAKLYLSWY